jgi:hypothetical protein
MVVAGWCVLVGAAEIHPHDALGSADLDVEAGMLRRGRKAQAMGGRQRALPEQDESESNKQPTGRLRLHLATK